MCKLHVRWRRLCVGGNNESDVSKCQFGTLDDTLEESALVFAAQ